MGNGNNGGAFIIKAGDAIQYNFTVNDLSQVFINAINEHPTLPIEKKTSLIEKISQLASTINDVTQFTALVTAYLIGTN